MEFTRPKRKSWAPFVILMLLTFVLTILDSQAIWEMLFVETGLYRTPLYHVLTLGRASTTGPLARFWHGTSVGLFLTDYARAFPGVIFTFFPMFALIFAAKKKTAGAMIFGILNAILAIVMVIASFSMHWAFSLCWLMYLAASTMILIGALSPGDGSKASSVLCIILGILSILVSIGFTFCMYNWTPAKGSTIAFIGARWWQARMPLYSTFLCGNRLLVTMNSAPTALWPLSRGLLFFAMAAGFAKVSEKPIPQSVFGGYGAPASSGKRASSGFGASPAGDLSGIRAGSIPVMILLTIVTCGIYGWVWYYRMIRNMRIINGEDTSCAGEFLLFMFIPFYFIYWYYTRGKRFAQSAQARGYAVEDRSTLYLILGLVGFSVINLCLIQSDFNGIARGVSAQAKSVPVNNHDSGNAYTVDATPEKSAPIYSNAAFTNPVSNEPMRSGRYESPVQEPIYEPVIPTPVYEEPDCGTSIPVQDYEMPDFEATVPGPAHNEPSSDPAIPMPVQDQDAFVPLIPNPPATDSEPKPAPPARGSMGVNDGAEALEKLARLRDLGILTEDEFRQKKADILSKM